MDKQLDELLEWKFKKIKVLKKEKSDAVLIFTKDDIDLKIELVKNTNADIKIVNEVYNIDQSARF